MNLKNITFGHDLPPKIDFSPSAVDQTHLDFISLQEEKIKLPKPPVIFNDTRDALGGTYAKRVAEIIIAATE